MDMRPTVDLINGSCQKPVAHLLMLDKLPKLLYKEAKPSTITNPCTPVHYTWSVQRYLQQLVGFPIQTSKDVSLYRQVRRKISIQEKKRIKYVEKETTINPTWGGGLIPHKSFLYLFSSVQQALPFKP